MPWEWRVADVANEEQAVVRFQDVELLGTKQSLCAALRQLMKHIEQG